MDGDGQLDDAEPGAQMPAGHRHRGDHFLAQLVGQLRQLRLGQRANVGGRIYRVEQRGDRPMAGAVAHARPIARAVRESRTFGSTGSCAACGDLRGAGMSKF